MMRFSKVFVSAILAFSTISWVPAYAEEQPEDVPAEEAETELPPEEETAETEVIEEEDETAEEAAELEQLTDEQGYEYQIDAAGGAAITGYSGGEIAVIPEVIDSHPVTSITKDAFRGSSITEVTLPKSLKLIGRGAFAECGSLKKVTVRSTYLEDLPAESILPLIDWQSSVFYHSGAEEGVEVVFGEGVLRVPSYLFATGQSQDRNRFFRICTVTLPSSLKEVGAFAFYNCFLLKDVNYGSDDQSWTKVTVWEGNDCLTSAEIHYQGLSMKVSLYRMYNPNTGEHFYTPAIEEREMLVQSGWKYEGVAFYAPLISSKPIFRLYNPNAGDHHYTGSEIERAFLIRLGWIAEGIAWYSDDAKSVSVYRLYNPNAKTGMHHYTASEKEVNVLQGMGWKYEGVSFFACEK